MCLANCCNDVHGLEQAILFYGCNVDMLDRNIQAKGWMAVKHFVISMTQQMQVPQVQQVQQVQQAQEMAFQQWGAQQQWQMQHQVQQMHRQAMEQAMQLPMQQQQQMQQEQQQQQQLQQQQLLVSQALVGRLIGKGGSGIKALREMSGTTIKVFDECEPGTTERKVIVTGGPEQVQHALSLIAQTLNLPGHMCVAHRSSRATGRSRRRRGSTSRRCRCSR